MGINLARVMGHGTAVEEPPIQNPALRGMIAIDGPKAAAWLIAKHRKSIRKAGVLALSIPEDKQLPTWARYAIEHLRTCPKRWAVTVAKKGTTLVYGITWLDWGRWQRS